MCIPTSSSGRLESQQQKPEVATPHVSLPKLMGDCLTWHVAAEEERLSVSSPQLFIHTRRPRRLLRGSPAPGKVVLGLLKDVPGERRGQLSARVSAGERSCVQADSERRQPADLGAPSPSERSAEGVQLPGRTQGGDVAHQIPLIVGSSGEGAPCNHVGLLERLGTS